MKTVVIDNNKIYTSYFAVVDRYVGSSRQVSIALSTPKGFKGSYFLKLAPTWEILSKYKAKQISESQYNVMYRDSILYKQDPREVYEALRGKVLCCWEKSGDFCHRHIVLDWLVENLGPNILGGEI